MRACCASKAPGSRGRRETNGPSARHNSGTQTEAAFDDAELVVISPGVPADLDLLGPVRARGVPVIGELELAAAVPQGRTIGITGTNGKTTTTALTGHILRESGIPCQVGGNIGTPPASMVETSRPEQWNVLELSSFQLETIQTFHAPIAAVPQRDARIIWIAITHSRITLHAKAAIVRNAATPTTSPF